MSAENSVACFSFKRIVGAFGTVKWMSNSLKLGVCSNRTNANESLDSITARVAVFAIEGMADKSLLWAYCLEPFQRIYLPLHYHGGTPEAQLIVIVLGISLVVAIFVAAFPSISPVNSTDLDPTVTFSTILF